MTGNNQATGTVPFLAFTLKYGWITVCSNPKWGGYLTIPGRYGLAEKDIVARADLPATPAAGCRYQVGAGMSDNQTTKRVRILVAIDSDGRWVSGGYDYGEGSNPKEWLLTDSLGIQLAYHWIEANVPVPAETMIEGTASDA